MTEGCHTHTCGGNSSGKKKSGAPKEVSHHTHKRGNPGGGFEKSRLPTREWIESATHISIGERRPYLPSSTLCVLVVASIAANDDYSED